MHVYRLDLRAALSIGGKGRATVGPNLSFYGLAGQHGQIGRLGGAAPGHHGLLLKAALRSR